MKKTNKKTEKIKQRKRAKAVNRKKANKLMRSEKLSAKTNKREAIINEMRDEYMKAITKQFETGK